ncbi:hypothetical protein LLH00_00225 [bacterium]|nr:hypothetical protein [bacterium]
MKAIGALNAFACAVMMVVIVFGAGCGVIFKGSNQHIAVMCSPDARLAIQPDGMEQTTPTSLELARNKNYVLTFSKEGYESKKIEIRKTASAGIIVLDVVLTGLVGVVVDAATGSWYNLRPESVSVELVKQSTSLVPTESDQIQVTIDGSTEETVKITSSVPGVNVTVEEMGR